MEWPRRVTDRAGIARGRLWRRRFVVDRADRGRSARGRAAVVWNVSRWRRSQTHVACYAASSGGGRSGAREMLAGSDGCARATTGTGETGAAIAARTGDGAWQEPPHPQSNSRESTGADTVGVVRSPLEATAASDPTAGVSMSVSQRIIEPTLDPSNEPRSGS
jgi:hypothetical protein